MQGTTKYPKWITVYLELFFKKEATVDKAVTDIEQIVNRTRVVYDLGNKPMGCINRYLGIDSLHVDGMIVDIPHHVRSLYKQHSASVSHMPDRWHLVSGPKNSAGELERYSLEVLYLDLPVLSAACELIEKRYHIPRDKLHDRIVPMMRGPVPWIRHKQHFVAMEYTVEDRLAYPNYDLDKLMFGNNVQSCREQIAAFMRAEPVSPWTAAVKKLMS
jgi:hypothetical protein